MVLDKLKFWPFKVGGKKSIDVNKEQLVLSAKCLVQLRSLDEKSVTTAAAKKDL